jgi:hypothetical protein
LLAHRLIEEMEVPTAGSGTMVAAPDDQGNGRVVQYKGLYSGRLCAGTLIALGDSGGRFEAEVRFRDARESLFPRRQADFNILRRLGKYITNYILSVLER